MQKKCIAELPFDVDKQATQEAAHFSILRAAPKAVEINDEDSFNSPAMLSRLPKL